MPLSRIGTNSITDFAIGATDLANNSIETYTSNTGRPLTNRNLIINGAMQVAQRNTSVTGITTSGYRTADRWRLDLGSAGTWTMNVESSAPDNTEFRKSANLVCTTADSSLSAGDAFIFEQRIEGQNLQGIKKGTVNAESLTVSFYVKSSNTGTYICEFFDQDNQRQISKSYTINAANTWEKKTITIPPDTTGQLDNDNAGSFTLFFWLAAGTTYTSGTLNSSTWASNVEANRAVGVLNLANLSGNYWAVTGVQLETGTVATPFEVRNIGDELALCQRYAYVQRGNSGDRCGFGYCGTTVLYNLVVPLPVTMRAAPTLSSSTTIQVNDNISAYDSSAITIGDSVTNTTVYLKITSSGMTIGRGSQAYFNTASGSFVLSAEL